MKKRKNRTAPKTLTEAMQMAVEALGSGKEVKLFDVAYWIECRWPRHWAYTSISSYFSRMARPQVFERTKRGYYTNKVRKSLLRVVA